MFGPGHREHEVERRLTADEGTPAEVSRLMRRLLLRAIPLFACVHLVSMVLFKGHFVWLNLLIGLAPLLAAACIWWRMRQIARWQRSAWYWILVGLLTWSVAQMCELHGTQLGNNATPTFGDYLFFVVGIPLLLGISSTPATRGIPSVRLLNAAQSMLAAGLIYVRFFRMPVTAGTGGVSVLYDAEFLLLFVTALLRLLAATVPEDRRTLGLVFAYLMIYMPAESVTDVLARRWHLQIGTPLDLCFTLPFLFLGYGALRMSTADEAVKRDTREGQTWRLFLQSLCPMLFTCGVFALGVSVARQHLLLASTTMLLCLFLQGLHAGAIQTRYVLDHNQLQRQEKQLVNANEKLQRLSLTDELTGISNRRHLMEALSRECERAGRREEWLSVLMIDVDHFKGVNDLHGHAYGDECLSALAHLLTSINRGMDLAGRYGGEEFLLMLPNTDANGAEVVARRLHAALDERDLPNRAAPLGRITVSVGVATARMQRGMQSTALLEAADAAMYEAKQGGRNQTRAMELGADLQVPSVLRS